MNQRLGLIVTFYSYKGGVGRTMALASVAVAAARRGQRVLCVDWDLEAPGLDTYFKRWSPGLEDHAGVLELCTRELLDWRDAVVPVKIPEVPFHGAGRLDIITSGRRDETYADRLSRFAWREEYEHPEHALAERLDTWREAWMAAYDLVLIDSRTGLSDMGGISTIHLPNVLVVFFTPNDQSVDGARRVARACQKEQANLGFARPPLRVVPVPTRIDTAEMGELKTWRETIHAAFGPFVHEWADEGAGEDAVSTWFDRVSVPYVPFWAYGERIPAVEETRPDKLSVSYALEPLEALLRTRFEAAGALLRADGGELATSEEKPVWEPPTSGELKDLAAELTDEERTALDRYLVARLLVEFGLPDTSEPSGRRFAAYLRSVLRTDLQIFIASDAEELWLPPDVLPVPATAHLLMRFRQVRAELLDASNPRNTGCWRAILAVSSGKHQPLAIRGSIPWLRQLHEQGPDLAEFAELLGRFRKQFARDSDHERWVASVLRPFRSP